MAFDPNAIPKDLRPINIARTLAEDPRIPPISSPASIPVYYPSPIVDTGFTGLGGYNTNNNIIKNNNIPNGTPSIGIRNNPNSGVRKGGSASSQASDEGGDDSISGKKVKFLCSFGGKIMPRPSDGMLRYVGGQTKIITVRRDVSFVELVQKIINTCGQNLIIKYQLPDEDLDALVSVSCPEDLENMMDEYEKLVERSADGSPKLRVFLFSSSEIDSSGMGNFVLQDNSRQYVEMVNSVADLVTPGSGIKRRESNASLTSTQNSDLSATEGIDSSTVAQGDLNLNKEKIAPIQDPSPRLKPVSPRIIVETETPSAQLNIPIIQPEHEWERPMPVSIHNTHNIHNIHPPAPYYQTFVDPQMGFPSQVMRNVSPIYTNNNVSNIVPPQQQYIAPMNMTMAPPPPSHVSMRENIMMPVMQPPQNNFAPRIIQLPNGQSYHAYPAQIGPSMVRGPYGWVPNQQIIGTFPEEIQKFKDCDLCEKSLPHAHSDTVVQGQRASIANPPIDTASVYHSLRVDDKKALPVRNFIEPQGNILSHIDNESGKTQVESVSAAKIELYYDNNFDNTKAALPSYDVAMGIRPQQFQENAPLIQPMPAQYQFKQNITMNPLVNNDIHLVNESPKEYMNNILASAAKEVIVDSYDHVREIERPTENLHISPPETKPIVENVPIKPIMDFDLNYLHTNEMSPPLGEVSYIHTTRPIEFSEISKPPLLGNDTQYENRPDESSYKKFPFSEKVQPVDWSLDSSKLQPNLVPTDATVASSIPIKKVADLPQDSSNLLFSNQDPWDLQHDTHFPPPLPNKIAIRKDGLGTRAPFDENQFCDFGELTKGNAVERGTEVRLDEVDFASRTAQGSAEEQIKRDLQGVAEGVAASVLKSSMPSDPDLTKLERSEKVSEAIRNKNVRNDIEMHKARNEETKSKLPEKANLGFPTSDGIGSLQIIKNSDLEELRELGSGTFGTVYHGKWRGSDVAIKRINDRCFAGKPSEIERMRDDFWNEAIKLADLHHPNVVAFYGVVLDGPGGSVATVTEYMVNGSLRTALQKNERNLDKRKRLLIAMDVAFGMEYLHGKNIVHFDLKSDNLLVNLRDPHRPICKVGDLGLSKVKCQTLISGGVRGTLPWMAPELLNGSSSLVSEKVDVFSYGIVMWELITGEEPYADLHYGAIIGGIVSNTLRPPVPESCDPEWRSLMERCWSAEPSERPNFTEIANELRAIAAKIQSKTQNQQPVPSTQPQTKT